MTSTLNFRTLDLNLLRVFDVVMAERNLTRAAERLSLTQPAVSNALKRLKESVGEDLLIRVATGVRPTPRAEALWPEVRDALVHLRAAFSPGEYNPQTDTANFRIAMSDAVAARYLPALMAEIDTGRALANIQVLPLTVRDPGELLERGQAELALGDFSDTAAAAATRADVDSPLRSVDLQHSDCVCVMRRGHPLAADHALTLDAYCAADHLLVNFVGRPTGRVDQALATLGRNRRVVLTVNQYATAAHVVARSNLLSVLPAAFVDAGGGTDHHPAGLVTRPLPFDIPGHHLAMVWHQRHDRSSAHRWLREQLEAAVRMPLH